MKQCCTQRKIKDMKLSEEKDLKLWVTRNILGSMTIGTTMAYHGQDQELNMSRKVKPRTIFVRIQYRA